MDVNKFSLYHEPTTLFSEIKYDTYMYILLENGGCMGFRICLFSWIATAISICNFMF